MHIDRINAGIRVKEIRSCVLCNHEGDILYQGLKDHLFGVEGTWALKQCPKCNLIWLNPCPIPVDIGKLYKQYSTHVVLNNISRFVRIQKIINNAILVSHLGYNQLSIDYVQKGIGKFLALFRWFREMVELSVMTLEASPKSELLDIGCGSGQFIARMRDLGWVVVGVEPDRQAVKVAREHFGLTVHEGMLDEMRFPSGKFDAITLSQVIEHVPDFIDTLSECKRVLKPGGRLVIVTPNIDSLGHRIFGKSWRGLEIPRHLHLFSPRSIRTSVERAGLDVLELRGTSWAASWLWACSRLIQRNEMFQGSLASKRSIWMRIEGLAFRVVEHLLGWFKNVGEELIIISTKKKGLIVSVYYALLDS